MHTLLRPIGFSRSGNGDNAQRSLAIGKGIGRIRKGSDEVSAFDPFYVNTRTTCNTLNCETLYNGPADPGTIDALQAHCRILLYSNNTKSHCRRRC